MVVRADGDVLASTTASGLWRSTDGGATFAPIADVRFDAWCLGEHPGGALWMCTNNLPPDGATLQVSTTGAAGTWTKQLTYADITGPHASSVERMPRFSFRPHHSRRSQSSCWTVPAAQRSGPVMSA